MQFNQEQIDTLAKYFSDLSKILFGSTVLGFFIPSAETQITLSMFIVGVSATITCLVLVLNYSNEQPINRLSYHYCHSYDNFYYSHAGQKII